jgi:hypothetical protein
MRQGVARPISSENPLEVAIEVFDEGKNMPSRVVRRTAPVGFPPDLLPHLADFMAQGFNAACDPEVDRVLDLSDFAPSPRGRRSNPDNESRGQQAAKLHSEGLSYRDIAKELCPEKGHKGHKCKKKCADRIRQNAEAYKQKEFLERLAQGEV